MSHTENVEKKTSQLTPSYLEVVLIVLIVACGLLYGYDQYVAQKVRVVDMGSYFRGQKALLAAGKISGEDLKAGMDKIDQRIALEAQQHKNHIIILKEVVLKNGNELKIQ